ncbi:MAG: hypothetical protein M1828_005549 [Chrysothrix sp. TS-e1954]|nr:MAG: hypothetical protein M1828_005549 [Chrysothrix sp. TS-e1954]
MEPKSKTDVSRKARKFAVEPVETSSWSSQGSGANRHSDTDGSITPTPIPKEQSANGTPKNESHTRRRFTPQPMEESSRSNRKQDNGSGKITTSPPTISTSQDQLVNADDTSKKPARRKFAPQLIETAQRSRKSTDEGPTITAHDKTNVSPDDASDKPRPPRPPPAPTPPFNTPTQTASDQSFLKATPNRQGSMYPHYNTRQHSFKVPELPAIESSESSVSSQGASDDLPSLSTLSSPSSAEKKKQDGWSDATRRRESLDDRFSGYLLSLAARAAEKQLREQAAAAFPNSDFPDISQQVNHFVDHEDSDEEMTSPERSRHRNDRATSEEEKLALKEMRNHGASVRNLNDSSTLRPDGVDKENKEASKSQSRHDAWTTTTPPKKLIGGRQNDPDLKQMRKAASPPMLGGDIDFPRCPSPENARFDVTQGADYLRRSMCYLSNKGDENGLWGGPGGQRPTSPQPPALYATDSNTSQRSASRRDLSPGGAPGGLWGGLCTPSDHRQSIPTGLVTPRPTPQGEREDPFATLSSVSSALSTVSSGSSVAGPRSPPQTRQNLQLPTPPPSQPDSTGPDLQSKLELEFPHAFITQVYNYLSLGFPALARKFDEELSRISGVALEDLREDDKLAENRGYLRLGDDEISKEELGVQEESCARWRALRIYCREWGRQMGACEGGDGRGGKALDPHRAWGLPGRKGSWGN